MNTEPTKTLAGSGEPARPPCSDRIGGNVLSAILARHGIIDPRAVEDAEGYDGGMTMLRVGTAAREIMETIGPNDQSDPQPVSEAVERGKENVSKSKTSGRKSGAAVRVERIVSPIDETEALEYLRENHPEFFESESSRELAAVIVLEMADELAKHGGVERSGMIAAVMALMYRMGTAALKTIRDEKHRGMARILVDDYRANDQAHRPLPGGERPNETQTK